MATNDSVNSPLSGTTGTGNFVGSNSPTIVTPNITTPSITGITSGSNPGAGIIGQLLSSPTAVLVAQTSNNPTQIQTLILTAGAWLVWGNYYTIVGGSTITQSIITACCTSTASIPVPSSAQTSGIFSISSPSSAGVPAYCQTGTSLWNVSGSTTVYLNATTAYTVSTLVGNGAIYALRIA